MSKSKYILLRVDKKEKKRRNTKEKKNKKQGPLFAKQGEELPLGDEVEEMDKGSCQCWMKNY